MKVPAGGFALIDEAKIRKYLLASTHPQGWSKAHFFTSLGFRPAAWRQLAAALRAHVQDHHCEESVVSSYGVKYIVRGALRTPTGRVVDIVSIWIVEHGRRRPRFVTAYPGGKA